VVVGNKDLGRDRCYCRGGPPWPPGLELDLGKHARGKERNSTPGGHGGPPLQFAPSSTRTLDAQFTRLVRYFMRLQQDGRRLA